MLKPKSRLVIEDRNGQDYCTTKYSVYDTDECGFIENKIFGIYETEEECQREIDNFNSFSLVKFA